MTKLQVTAWLVTFVAVVCDVVSFVALSSPLVMTGSARRPAESRSVGPTCAGRTGMRTSVPHLPLPDVASTTLRRHHETGHGLQRAGDVLRQDGAPTRRGPRARSGEGALRSVSRRACAQGRRVRQAAAAGVARPRSCVPRRSPVLGCDEHNQVLASLRGPRSFFHFPFSPHWDKSECNERTSFFVILL